MFGWGATDVSGASGLDSNGAEASPFIGAGLRFVHALVPLAAVSLFVLFVWLKSVGTDGVTESGRLDVEVSDLGAASFG